MSLKDETPTFTLDEIKQVHAEHYQNVECMTCARLLMYLSALIADYERLKDENTELRDIVDALVDTGKCQYDHHGYCQEHLWFKSDVECPHARAQRLWDADGNELPIALLAEGGK